MAKMTIHYKPQDHAAALADWTDLLRHQVRQTASVEGKLDRLLEYLKPKATGLDIGLDGLIEAAFAAMRSDTWTVSDLLGRSLRNDVAGIALLQAVTGTGKANARALGRYLAALVPGAGYLTPDGLELHRSGQCGTVLLWTIAQV
jgi:hypothetical protein